MIDVIIVMGILILCKTINAMKWRMLFSIFKVSRLVRLHTDSHRSDHNKMIFAVSYV